jgi:hypothetical protein
MCPPTATLHMYPFYVSLHTTARGCQHAVCDMCPLYMCPHTTPLYICPILLYVSSYYFTCVLILQGTVSACQEKRAATDRLFKPHLTITHFNYADTPLAACEARQNKREKDKRNKRRKRLPLPSVVLSLAPALYCCCNRCNGRGSNCPFGPHPLPWGCLLCVHDGA